MRFDARVGDVLDVCGDLEAGSVDLIATDPPYFKVKDAGWDRAWDNDDHFIEWIGEVSAAFLRVLAPNGSLYVFASPRLAARVEVTIGQHFNVLNTITWAKPAFATKAEMFRKSDLRSFFPASERIIFAEPHTATDSWVNTTDGIRGSVFEPLRKYLADELKRSGTTTKELVDAMGVTTPSHYFSRSQWALPTEEHYETMRQVLNNGHVEYLRRDYEDLRRDYEDLRRDYEDLRRPFNATPDTPYTDVWTFPTVTPGPFKHECQKPVTLMEHIITVSSRPGDTVFDPFMGSGTTGVAAVNLGRHFIGSDLSQHWVDYARARSNQRTLFAEVAR